MLFLYQQLQHGCIILLGYLPTASIFTQASTSFISSCMCSTVACSPSLRWGTGTELK